MKEKIVNEWKKNLQKWLEGLWSFIMWRDEEKDWKNRKIRRASHFKKKNLLKLSLRKLKTLDSLSQIKMDKNF